MSDTTPSAPEAPLGPSAPATPYATGGMRDRRDGRVRTRPGRPFYRKKFCKFCARSSSGVVIIDYKDTDTLRRCTTDRGKILPRRVTGNCAKCQRKVSAAIKRARALALLPFTAQ